jgi:hypothetical protein
MLLILIKRHVNLSMTYAHRPEGFLSDWVAQREPSGRFFPAAQQAGPLQKFTTVYFCRFHIPP